MSILTAYTPGLSIKYLVAIFHWIATNLWYVTLSVFPIQAVHASRLLTNLQLGYSA